MVINPADVTYVPIFLETLLAALDPENADEGCSVSALPVDTQYFLSPTQRAK